jgi:hypothetical protein
MTSRREPITEAWRNGRHFAVDIQVFCDKTMKLLIRSELCWPERERPNTGSSTGTVVQIRPKIIRGPQRAR